MRLPASARVLAVIAVLPLLSGCALLRELLNTSVGGPPTATFVGSSLQDATLEGARVDVKFALQNPNPISMQVTGLKLTAEVDGQPVAAPPVPSTMTLRPDQRTELNVPVQLSFASLAGKESVRVRVHGMATAQSATGPVQLPLSHEETVAVAKTPELSLGLPRLTGLGFTSAGLELPLTMKNPNPYPLQLTSLDGSVKLGGAELGQVASGALGALAPGESRELPIPLVLEFSKVASTLLTAATAPVELSSQLKSGGATVPVKLSQSFGLPKAPKLSFGGVGFSELGLDGVTLELKYAVENPNALPIKLSDVRYALKVEGKDVVSGGPKDGTEIAANGKTDVVFPARVRFADLASSLPLFLQKDQAKFAFEGSLGSEGPAGKGALPLSHASSFKLPELPEFTIGAPKIAGMDFTSARIELPITLKNGNAFALPIGNLTGAVALSGAKIGNVSTGDLGQLQPGQPKTISLPLTLQLAEAAGAALALRGGTVPLSFNGELVTGEVHAPIQWSKSVQFTR